MVYNYLYELPTELQDYIYFLAHKQKFADVLYSIEEKVYIINRPPSPKFFKKLLNIYY